MKKGSFIDKIKNMFSSNNKNKNKKKQNNNSNKNNNNEKKGGEKQSPPKDFRKIISDINSFIESKKNDDYYNDTKSKYKEIDKYISIINKLKNFNIYTVDQTSLILKNARLLEFEKLTANPRYSELDIKSGLRRINGMKNYFPNKGEIREETALNNLSVFNREILEPINNIHNTLKSNNTPITKKIISDLKINELYQSLQKIPKFFYDYQVLSLVKKVSILELNNMLFSAPSAFGWERYKIDRAKDINKLEENNLGIYVVFETNLGKK